MESCATHMTHLVVEELLTLTALPSFFSNTRSVSFFFSNTPTQPYASLSQPRPLFSEQTQTGNFFSQTHRAQPHASLSSPPPLFSEKLRPARFGQIFWTSQFGRMQWESLFLYFCIYVFAYLNKATLNECNRMIWMEI